MKDSHKVWLEAHPERDAEWLLARTIDGFDVHHLDGDRSNNVPDNLVLIEHSDHLRAIHGILHLRRMLREMPRRNLKIGALCYDLRARGLKWSDVGREVGRTREYATRAAKQHAESNGLTWPITHPEDCICPQCCPRTPRRRNCGYCGVEFEYLPPTPDTRKFCSNECSLASRVVPA